jgi:hypothetical protein
VLNEAARMVEEGVADPESIDLAVRAGFGPSFSVFGPLEFIDRELPRVDVPEVEELREHHVRLPLGGLLRQVTRSS